MPGARLKDIAVDVGVSISAVSQVLRHRIGKIPVSDATRARILEAAERLNYEPRAASKAIVTGKTFNIGFFLSKQTTLGLANKFFASILSGVQVATEQRGYSCLVGVYDLTSIDSFVMPPKNKCRKVDAVILAGIINHDVIKRFIEYGIPFIVVCENLDYECKEVLASGGNPARRWRGIFEYLIGLGHRRFAFGTIYSSYQKHLLDNVLMEIKAPLKCDVFSRDADGSDEFLFGEQMAKEWISCKDRPSAIIGNSQFCVGFLDFLSLHSIECPKDISVVCTNDEVLCQRYHPKLTSLSTPEFENAKVFTNLLIDFIEQKIEWSAAQRCCEKEWNDGDLIIRESASAIYYNQNAEKFAL